MLVWGVFHRPFFLHTDGTVLQWEPFAAVAGFSFLAQEMLAPPEEGGKHRSGKRRGMPRLSKLRLHPKSLEKHG